LAGRGYGFVDLFAAGFGYLRDYGAVGGINVGEIARAAHKMAVDVILQEFHGAFCTSARFSRYVLRN
jgi:hypothetical protein